MPKKKTSKLEVRKSSCDDGMFMQSEIIVDFDPEDNLDGISLSLDLQSGRPPAYLRKGEIKELIDNLQYFHDKIPD